MAHDGTRRIFVNAGPIAHFSTGDVAKPLVGLEMSSDEQIHPSGYGFVAVPQVRTQLVLRSRDFAHPDPWHRRPAQAPGTPAPETSYSAHPYSHGPGVKILVP